MRVLFPLAAVAVVVVVLFLALDPSYQKMRSDEAFYRSQEQSLSLQREQLELDERRRVSDVEVVSQSALRGLVPVAVLLVLVVLGDWYYNRRRPLVRPDERGLLPVSRDALLMSSGLAGELAKLHQEVAALRAVHQPGQLPVNYAPRLDVRPSALPSNTNPTEDTTSAYNLPSAPSWAAIRGSGWSPSPERMLLGYGTDGALYGSVADLLSTAIAGRPGQGKSTLLRFVFAQVQLLGGEPVVWDLHGSIAEDLPGVSVCDDVPSIEQSATRIIKQLEARKASPVSAPLLLLVDEWPVLSLASRRAGAAVSKVVLEGRKFGMYALIAGQGLPADRFGGSLVRDALSSRYIFKTTAAQARMAGLDRSGLELVSLLAPGRAVLSGPVEPRIVAIPNITLADVSGLVSSVETEVSAPESGVSEFHEVKKLRESGLTKVEIIARLWGVSPGSSRKYQEASARYDEIISGL